MSHRGRARCPHRAAGAGPMARWDRRYLFTVAQIFNRPHRRFVIGRALLASGRWQDKNLRYSAARRSRNATLPLLHRMEERAGERRRQPLSSVLSPLLRRGARKKNLRSSESSRPATISIDTDRLQVCATGAASTLNRYLPEDSRSSTVPGVVRYPGSEPLWFPLTPALSRGEREKRSPRGEISSAFDCSQSVRLLFPLPPGEGQGEGRGDLAGPLQRSRLGVGLRCRSEGLY